MFGFWSTVLQGGVNLLAISVEPCLGIPAVGGGENCYQHKPRGRARKILSKILALEVNFFMDKSNNHFMQSTISVD